MQKLVRKEVQNLFYIYASLPNLIQSLLINFRQKVRAKNASQKTQVMLLAFCRSFYRSLCRFLIFFGRIPQN